MVGVSGAHARAKCSVASSRSLSFSSSSRTLQAERDVGIMQCCRSDHPTSMAGVAAKGARIIQA